MSHPTPSAALAQGLLPAPPAALPVLSDDGGLVELALERWDTGVLEACAPSAALREGLVLSARVEHPELGPHELPLTVTGVFFRTGETSLARLAPGPARRRPTTRAHTRAELAEHALARVLYAAATPIGSEFDVRAADVSATGVAFVTERPIAPGDLLELMLELSGRMIRMRARAVRTAAAHYGRHRVGCEITRISDADRDLIDAYARRAPARAGGGAPPAAAAGGGLRGRIGRA